MKPLPLVLMTMVWFFSSCVPDTPQQRIANNPALFQSLPAKHQALVQQGEIARGMSPAAVTLAWGDPSRRYAGMQNGAATERWDYAGSQPVYTNHIGFGYGGYGHGYGSYSSFGYGPDITYIPYRRATVLFKNQSVESWEKMQSPLP